MQQQILNLKNYKQESHIALSLMIVLCPFWQRDGGLESEGIEERASRWGTSDIPVCVHYYANAVPHTEKLSDHMHVKIQKEGNFALLF